MVICSRLGRWVQSDKYNEFCSCGGAGEKGKLELYV